MTDTALQTESAPVTLFNPADWLTRFRAVGGYFSTDSNGHPIMGWKLNLPTDPWGDAPRTIWREVEHDTDKRDAIRAHLITSAGEAAHGQA